MSGIRLSIKWADAVAAGEADAHRLIDAAGNGSLSPFGNRDPVEIQRRWLDALGATELEFKEMMDDLARRLAVTPWWRRKARKAIIRDYARLEGLTTAAIGLEITWR